MTLHEKSRRPGALMLAALLGGSVLAGATAPAAQAHPVRPYGTVLPANGVNEREYPSTDSSVEGVLPHGARVGLECKVRAQNIGGNTVWYLLRDRPTWVSARYVANTGSVPYCKERPARM